MQIIAKKRLGLLLFSRDGRVTSNMHFFLPYENHILPCQAFLSPLSSDSRGIRYNNFKWCNFKCNHDNISNFHDLFREPEKLHQDSSLNINIFQSKSKSHSEFYEILQFHRIQDISCFWIIIAWWPIKVEYRQVRA